MLKVQHKKVARQHIATNKKQHSLPKTKRSVHHINKRKHITTPRNITSTRNIKPVTLQQNNVTPNPTTNQQRYMSSTLKPENFAQLKQIYPNLPQKVKIVEVGPRDGLQNQSEILDARVKVKFINKLNQTGLSVIEAGSFVSPKWVPQMSSSHEVLSGIDRLPNVEYPVLVPNLQGLQRALEANVKEIAVFAAASEAFSQKNINCSIQQSIERFEPVLEEAKKHNLKIRAYVSCVLGCPYSGEVSPEEVARVAKLLYDKGCTEISLGDTIGTGNPGSTMNMLLEVMKYVPKEHLAVHFHDTYGQGLANVLVALQLGIATVDSSVASLGGCPYAAGASGNLGTEDLVYMLNGMGIETGVDLDKLLDASRYITGQLHIRPSSKTSRVLIANKKKFAKEFLHASDDYKRSLVPH